MCYSGKCGYEDHEGNCTIPWGTASYPEDALCVRIEREQEQEEQIALEQEPEAADGQQLSLFDLERR